MRHPTPNDISQRIHGPYNAVDYRSSPDVYVYAPEDMSWHAYLKDAGPAGNNLQMNGASGRHGFCHLEEIYVSPRQSVRKGQRIAKMGYTGLVIPAGPAGRHLHWVIRRTNGTYVYPPSLINEPFQEEDMKLTKDQLEKISRETGASMEELNNKTDAWDVVNAVLLPKINGLHQEVATPKQIKADKILDEVKQYMQM